MILHSKVEGLEPKIEMTGDNWTVYLDADKLVSSVRVRSFRDGDKFCPLGMKHFRKLGDFFTDRRIPSGLRSEIPLLVSGDEIVWVIGQAISENVKVDRSTSRILKLWVEKVVKNVE